VSAGVAEERLLPSRGVAVPVDVVCQRLKPTSGVLMPRDVEQERFVPNSGILVSIVLFKGKCPGGGVVVPGSVGIKRIRPACRVSGPIGHVGQSTQADSCIIGPRVVKERGIST
jgi:hypothetical protein